MPTTLTENSILPSLQLLILKLITEFNQIPDDRKSIIKELTDFVLLKSNASQDINLTFICTHNSRRSHISQIWAQTAAHYYGIKNVHCYSGGTEATAFNPRAVKAMQNSGYHINLVEDGNNPVYVVKYSDGVPPITVFSKNYDNDFNPKTNFAAIMTCSQADENCPFVPGADKRIALTYNDPKDFDSTPQEASKYAERVREIGLEILYAFAQAK